MMNARQLMRTAWGTIALATLASCDPPHGSPPEKSSAKPDLVFVGHEFRFVRTLPPTGNDLYTIALRLHNRGARPATVRVTGRSDGPLSSERPALANNGVHQVGSGETTDALFSWIHERDFPGVYRFVFRADADNQVPESNELNNTIRFERRF